jgi:rod shape-determining protein MreC
MKTLINVILRYHFFLLFVLLEGIALIMVISSDVEKKNAFFTSANAVTGSINKKINNWTAYFSLDKENEELRSENLKLKNKLEALKSTQRKTLKFKPDTSGAYRYEYLKARVIKNTVSKSKNFVTLDKGELDGVEKDFGVISPKGVVGVIVATSKRYSLVVSILNDRIGISAKIKKNDFFGSVRWDGDDYRFATLSGIPNHLDLVIGDTIVTNGYSAIFPKDVLIGTISKLSKDESTNFYDLQVKLSTDLKSLYNVYIVNNKNRNEQILLENIAEDEY